MPEANVRPVRRALVDEQGRRVVAFTANLLTEPFADVLAVRCQLSAARTLVLLNRSHYQCDRAGLLSLVGLRPAQ